MGESRRPRGVASVTGVNESIPTTCPRCRAALPGDAEFYGICPDCRRELRGRWSGEARDVTAAEYVPTMNVTPNAVATKD